MASVRLLITMVILGWVQPLIQAQTPALLPCEGWIKSAGVEFNGQGQFKFALVTPAGAAVWSNSPMSGAQPTAAVALGVSGGFFHLLLGDTALPGMASLVPGDFTTPGLRLRVWFNDGTRGFQQLTPDQPLATMSAAAQAATAETVVDGAVTTAGLADDSVTTAQLTGPITSGRVADSIALGAAAAGGSGGGTGHLDIFATGNGPAITLDGPAKSLEIFGGIDGVLGSRQRRVRLDGADSGYVELYDEAGGTLSARLQAFPTGGASLLYHGGGTLRASLVGLDSGGAATLYQADGQAGVTVDGDSAGSGALLIANAAGASRVRARGGSGTGGSLEIMNDAGTVTTLLSHSEAHGLVSLRDGGGSERLYARASTPSAVLGLLNAAGEVTAQLASSSAGPAAGTMALHSAGGDRVAVMTSVVAPTLKLTNSTGSDLVLAQGGTSGRLHLQDADGFAGIRLTGHYKADVLPDLDHGGNLTFNDADWRNSNCLSSEEGFPTIRWRGDLTVNGSVTTGGGAFLDGNTWAYEGARVTGIVECAEVIINSDARLKDIGPRWTTGLGSLRGVRPVTWTWKPGNARQHQSGRQHAGVLAHELRRTLPEAVVEGEDGYLSVQATPVVWALANACRELAEEREALDRRAAGLTRERADLLQRLEKLEHRLQSLNP